MAKIRKLEAATIALIAAGEVVEGPWSVVKELMENSLDAGAGRVEVSLKGGGLEEVKVADDGHGMEEEDLRLAFERHATSKVLGPGDLDAVATMGFRGEALPAIAAVSRVTVYTRAAAADAVGLKATVVDGAVAVAPEGAAPGTTVIARDLFYNVPARRKFAGKPASEWRRAAEVFKRLALARLGPAFALKKDGRLQYAVGGAAGTPRTRIGEVLGWELGEELIEVEAAEGDLELHAFLSRPPRSFVGTSNIYTIINGRPARAKPLFKAVMSAYEGRLERSRYPLVVLYFTLPPGDVDVNVHPRKEEVRFAAEARVFDVVRRALRSALGKVAVAAPAAAFESAARPASAAAATVTEDIKKAVEGYLTRHELWPRARREGRAAGGDEVLGLGGGAAAPAAPQVGADVEVLGRLDDTYIIVRRGRDLVVVDQHTAHERVIYERLSRRRGAGGRQRLLLPVTVTLSPAAAADVRYCLATLAGFGFEVEEFGGNGFVIRSHPAGLRLGDVAGFLSQVVEDYAAAGRPTAAEERREAVLKSIACHAAVRAGERLTAAEAAALVTGLFAAATPDVCPHGRPTMVNLAARELERLFRR